MLRWSVTGCVTWYAVDAALESLLATRQLILASLEERSSENLAYYQSGPANPDGDAMQAAAKIWIESSLALDQLARGGGIDYFHMLQPNQYVAGSKPWFDESEKHEPEPERTVLGYPVMMRAAEAARLAERISYHDLTGMFRDADEVIYSDKCCHLNERGNEMLAEEMARIILNGR
jgi:hypothetical protein